MLALPLAALAAPFAALAQPARKTWRVAIIRPGPDDAVFRDNFRLFPQRLREHGFVEGTNLALDYRVRPGTLDEIGGVLRDVVGHQADVLLAVSPVAVHAASRVTKSVPIVAVDLESDPIASGFVAGLARPGGNVTGLFLDLPELTGKWIQLLRELVPQLTRLGVVWDPATGRTLLQAAETAARALRVEVVALEARGVEDFTAAFETAAQRRVSGMLFLSSPVVNSARARIADLAARHRVPAIMPFPGFAQDGGLVAYGPEVSSMFAQAADVVLKILRGNRPGDIPIERPTRFELVVNAKTAKLLGLTVPPSLRLRADQVIE